MTDTTHCLWGKNYACKTWHSANQPVIVALHGWLDNAGSFDRIAPLLPNYHIIAPDFAGHGFSDYRSSDAGYNLWQDAGDIDQLLRNLSADPVILMGHSRGGMISNILAALYPERIKALVLLDGSMPGPVSAETSVAQLKNAFDDRRKYLDKPIRHYKQYDEAIQSRLRGPLPMSRDAIDILATRGLAEDEDGYFWRADPRLRGASEVKFSIDQSNAFIRQVQCPALLIAAENSVGYHRQWLADNDNYQVKTVNGSHHLHLEETHGEVANMISTFLTTIDESG